MVLSSVLIGISLALLAVTGLVAMAVYVAATEEGRYQDAEPIE